MTTHTLTVTKNFAKNPYFHPATCYRCVVCNHPYDTGHCDYRNSGKGSPCPNLCCYEWNALNLGDWHERRCVPWQTAEGDDYATLSYHRTEFEYGY